MSKKLLVMTEEQRKNLMETFERRRQFAAYRTCRAAMTEVDLNAIASEWLADETDKSFTEILLAHMEGK